jgi:hypothetical protein
MSTVPDTLRAFGPQTLVVRAVQALVAGMPGEKPVVPYASLEDVVGAVLPSSEASVRAAAETLALDPIADAVLQLGAAVDGTDRLLARQLSASQLAPGTDAHTVQAEDATLKALALASFARRVSPATATDPAARARAFLELPSGRLMGMLWATVDVALPLGGTDVARMVALHQATSASRLASLGGEQALDGAVPTWGALAPLLQELVDRAAPRTDALAAALAPFVPGLIARLDGAAERIAAQSDRMPIYKWLAARLAAEHAVMRATGPRS